VGELKVIPLLSTCGISLVLDSSGSILSKCSGPKIGIAKGEKAKENKEGHIARVSVMTVEIRDLMLGIILSRLSYFLSQLG